jgi:hypothetical protein
MSVANPQEAFQLRAEGSDEVQRLVAVAALGMCRALATGSLSPAYACRRLFGPALLVHLQKSHVLPALKNAIHLATELEDVANLVPDQLDASISEIETELLKVLKKLAPHDLAGEKWLAKSRR